MAQTASHLNMVVCVCVYLFNFLLVLIIGVGAFLCICSHLHLAMTLSSSLARSLPFSARFSLCLLILWFLATQQLLESLQLTLTDMVMQTDNRSVRNYLG